MIYQVWCPDYHEESDALKIFADSYSEAVEDFCHHQHGRGYYEYANGHATEVLARVEGQAPRRFEIEVSIQPVFLAREVTPR